MKLMESKGDFVAFRKELGKGNILRVEFDGWGEFVEFCDAPLRADGTKYGTGYSHRDMGEWGGGSWPHIMNLARWGWPEGLAAVKKLADPLVEKLTDVIEKFEPYHTTEGTGTLDLGKYLEGDPECWVAFNPKFLRGPGRHITLIMNAASSGGIGAQSLLAKGATVTALIDLLELGGCRCKVIFSCAAAARGWHYQSYVPVKDFAEPLDRERIVFAMAHPSTGRTLDFSCMEHLSVDWFDDKLGCSYGYPESLPDKCDISVIHSSYGEPQWTDPKQAEAWILEQLALFGVLKAGVKP